MTRKKWGKANENSRIPPTVIRQERRLQERKNHGSQMRLFLTIRSLLSTYQHRSVLEISLPPLTQPSGRLGIQISSHPISPPKTTQVLAYCQGSQSTDQLRNHRQTEAEDMSPNAPFRLVPSHWKGEGGF